MIQLNQEMNGRGMDMTKGLYQELEQENKKRFGVKIAFNAVSGHPDTMGICTYEDMKEYNQFDTIFDFIDYEKSGTYTNVDAIIANAKLNGCKRCRVLARKA